MCTAADKHGFLARCHPRVSGLEWSHATEPTVEAEERALGTCWLGFWGTPLPPYRVIVRIVWVHAHEGLEQGLHVINTLSVSAVSRVTLTRVHSNELTFPLQLTHLMRINFIAKCEIAPASSTDSPASCLWPASPAEQQASLPCGLPSPVLWSVSDGALRLTSYQQFFPHSTEKRVRIKEEGKGRREIFQFIRRKPQTC